MIIEEDYTYPCLSGAAAIRLLVKTGDWTKKKVREARQASLVNGFSLPRVARCGVKAWNVDEIPPNLEEFSCDWLLITTYKLGVIRSQNIYIGIIKTFLAVHLKFRYTNPIHKQFVYLDIEYNKESNEVLYPTKNVFVRLDNFFIWPWR